MYINIHICLCVCVRIRVDIFLIKLVKQFGLEGGFGCENNIIFYELIKSWANNYL